MDHWNVIMVRRGDQWNVKRISPHLGIGRNYKEAVVTNPSSALNDMQRALKGKRDMQAGRALKLMISKLNTPDGIQSPHARYKTWLHTIDPPFNNPKPQTPQYPTMQTRDRL
jgi:hypothetical protein